MNSKFYKIMLKVFMIFLLIINFCANFSYGANKVSAKDIVSLYASGWEEKYNPSTASLTRDYMNKTLGDKVLKKIDKDYKNIKITQNDLKGLNKKQKVMLLGVLKVKWAEMSKSDKEKYQKAGHFNFDGINESINQDETDEAYNNAVKGNTKIYKQPGREETNGSANTLDDMIADADNFVSAAGKSNKINNAELADLCIRFEYLSIESPASAMNRISFTVLFKLKDLVIQAKLAMLDSIGKSAYSGTKFRMLSQVTF